MQKWSRIHEYASQYQKWVYKVYAEHGPGYLCTYWNLDLPNSVYDGNILDGGSYQTIGQLSGMKWRKILLLPVFHIEQIQPAFNADEEGYTKKEQFSSFTIPTEYNFQPSPYDYVKFEQEILHPDDNSYPLYKIINFEKATNTDKTLWKVNVKIDYTRENKIDKQLSQVCVFFDYTKRIYDSNKGSFMYQLLDKNVSLGTVNKFFNQKSGLFFQEPV